jgi:O-antigen/teichoic acid export membrane protein
MRQTLKRLARMIIGYGAVQWAGPLIALIFTPIITRVLSPADYGIADYVLTIGSAVTIVALFALPQALLTHFNNKPEITWQRRVTGSTLVPALVFAIIAGIGIFILAPWIAEASFGNQTYTYLFRLVGATFAFGTLGAILTTASQAALRVRWGMIFSLAAILSTVVGNVVFIVILRLGPAGLLLTPILTGTVISIVSFIVARTMIGAPAWPTSKLLLKSGALLLPAVASSWALQMIDRLFLVHYVTPTELGYYAIANKIAGLLYVALAPLYMAWTPLALAMQHDPQAKTRYADMSRIFVGLILFAALGLSLFSTEILIVLTRPAYLPASPYVGFLAYAQVFGGIGMLFYTGALVGKQLKAVSWSAFVGAGVNIILNYLLIPSYGLWGATIATVIGVAIPQVLLYLWLQRRYPIPYPTAKLLTALLVQFGLVLAGSFVPLANFWLRIAVKLVLLALLPVSYLLIGIISPYELKQAGLFARQRLRRLNPANK